MAKIFLDTNKLIDLIEGGNTVDSPFLGNSIITSPYCISTWLYIYKHKLPNHKVDLLLELLDIVGISSKAAKKSFLGPTNDYEDNLQLHAAVEAGCDVFLTLDKKLLKLGYFGKTKISDSL